MNRLILIDGHAILHRAYHALPPLTTSKGQIVNAVYGFISILLRTITELKPSHLAVAFDTPKPTFRNKLFKDYQIQRPKTDKELVSQIDILKNVIREMGIPTYEKDGYEADDVIGTIAVKASGQIIRSQKSKFPTTLKLRGTSKTTNENSKRESGIEIVIITGDRDILQLVDDQVKVYMPVKGLSKSKMYDEEEVRKLYGVTPSQIADYKALVGDTSDNYPGISGIGPKTARDLLVQFQTLKGIFSHLDSIINAKIKNKLKEGKKEGELSKKLSTIMTDVPLEFAIDKCILPKLDTPQIHWVLEELEFKSLIPRLNLGIKNQELRIKNNTKSDRKNNQISLF